MKTNVSQARAISYNVTRLYKERRRTAITAIDGDLNAFKRSRYTSEYWYLKRVFNLLETTIDIPEEFDRICWRMINKSDYLWKMYTSLPHSDRSCFLIVAMFVYFLNCDIDIESEVNKECIDDAQVDGLTAEFFEKLQVARELMSRPPLCVAASVSRSKDMTYRRIRFI